MFILAYIAIIIARANEVIIPNTASKIVGGLAIAEGVFYGLIIILNVTIFIFAIKD
jgi:hypothetical protein